MGKGQFPQGPPGSKRSHWQYGEYIYERVKQGESLRGVLNTLNEQLKERQQKPLSLTAASTLKRAYELYVIKYKMTLEELEGVSAFNLYRAQIMINNAREARAVVQRMEAGEPLKSVLESSDDEGARYRASLIPGKERF